MPEVPPALRGAARSAHRLVTDGHGRSTHGSTDRCRQERRCATPDRVASGKARARSPVRALCVASESRARRPGAPHERPASGPGTSLRRRRGRRRTVNAWATSGSPPGRASDRPGGTPSGRRAHPDDDSRRRATVRNACMIIDLRRPTAPGSRPGRWCRSPGWTER